MKFDRPFDKKKPRIETEWTHNMLNLFKLGFLDRFRLVEHNIEHY